MKVGFAFRISRVLRYMFHNQLRFVLTEIGLVLSLMIYLIPSFLLDSVYQSKFDDIAFWDKNSLIQFTFSSDAGDAERRRMNELFGTNYISFRQAGETTLPAKVFLGAGEISLVLKLYETNNLFNADLISTDEGIYPSKMLAGSGFTDEQISEQQDVMIIGQSLASILYPNGAVGNEIIVPHTVESGEKNGAIELREVKARYRICGVYDDSILSNTGNDDSESVRYFSVYIPIGNAEKNKAIGGTGILQFVFSHSEASQADVVGFVESSPTIMDYANYKLLRNNVLHKYEGYRRLTLYVTIAALIVSAFMICQTMIFAVKERMSEYGIKKAIGATPGIIVTELVLETVISALIGFCVALVSAVVIVLLIINLANYFGYAEGLSFSIGLNNVAVAFLMALLMNLFALQYPLQLIQKSDITDTIKFE